MYDFGQRVTFILRKIKFVQDIQFITKAFGKNNGWSIRAKALFTFYLNVS